MIKDNVGKIIQYRNDGTIKEVVAYEFDERYTNFLKVVDRPIKKKSLRKHMVWFSDYQERGPKEKLSKSGDWRIKRMLTQKEQEKLDKLLNKK